MSAAAAGSAAAASAAAAPASAAAPPTHPVAAMLLRLRAQSPSSPLADPVLLMATLAVHHQLLYADDAERAELSAQPARKEIAKLCYIFQEFIENNRLMNKTFPAEQVQIQKMLEADYAFLSKDTGLLHDELFAAIHELPPAVMLEVDRQSRQVAADTPNLQGAASKVAALAGIVAVLWKCSRVSYFSRRECAYIVAYVCLFLSRCAYSFVVFVPLCCSFPLSETNQQGQVHQNTIVFGGAEEQAANILELEKKVFTAQGAIIEEGRIKVQGDLMTLINSLISRK